MNYSIAIDGPAGAGKSTIAKEIAKKMNYIYVKINMFTVYVYKKNNKLFF